jgi:hypothetical protein
MFSFLKESWVHNYSDDEENEYSSHHPEPPPSPSPQGATFPSDNIQTPPPRIPNDNTLHESVIDHRLHRLQELEEQNSKFINQISHLQSIISSKSSLYLEYKEKYEVLNSLSLSLSVPLSDSLGPQKSETERVKSVQQSTDALISMQNEVNKLEIEVDKLRNQLSSAGGSSQVTFELFKATLEAEKAQVMTVCLPFPLLTLQRNVKNYFEE